MKKTPLGITKYAYGRRRTLAVIAEYLIATFSLFPELLFRHKFGVRYLQDTKILVAIGLILFSHREQQLILKTYVWAVDYFYSAAAYLGKYVIGNKFGITPTFNPPEFSASFSLFNDAAGLFVFTLLTLYFIHFGYALIAEKLASKDGNHWHSLSPGISTIHYLFNIFRLIRRKPTRDYSDKIAGGFQRFIEPLLYFLIIGFALQAFPGLGEYRDFAFLSFVAFSITSSRWHRMFKNRIRDAKDAMIAGKVIQDAIQTKQTAGGQGFAVPVPKHSD
ncbi:MAG: hypothetical protein AAFP70_06370, partial [Calditrichota bacterium]